MPKAKKTTRTPKLTKKAKPRKAEPVVAEEPVEAPAPETPKKAKARKGEPPIDESFGDTELAEQIRESARKAAGESRDGLCVFAFRLTEEERDAIHKAAGPAKASKFARTLLVAAARNDEAAVKAIMSGIQTA